MINRELQPVTVITFTDGVDSYGQPRLTIGSTRTIEAVIKPYSNTIVNDVRYNDCTLIALTQDRLINDGHVIRVDNVDYDVMYVIPSFRYNQLFLKKRSNVN